VSTLETMKKKYVNDSYLLGEEHEKLIEQILEDEEQLIFKHNSSCKESIQIVEKEMALLKDVDKPGSEVEQYVEKLDDILLMKI
jgi:kinesin family protein 2/24